MALPQRNDRITSEDIMSRAPTPSNHRRHFSRGAERAPSHHSDRAGYGGFRVTSSRSTAFISLLFALAGFASFTAAAEPAAELFRSVVTAENLDLANTGKDREGQSMFLGG
jgi:hypothetical protein